VEELEAPTLSVVVPMYNEAEVLPLLVGRLRPVLDRLDASYEVVAVDDGSRDSTFPMLTAIRRQWPNLRIVRLARNSGHQAALTAGLHRSRGDYVVSIDADLQDPPEKIAEMLDLARREGLDVVYGVRADRSTDATHKRATADMYYRLMRRIVGASVPAHAGDFRLMSRNLVNIIAAMPEQRPVYRLIVPWTGLPSGEVTYVREHRAAGSTKYPLSKMLKLAFDSIAGFSAAPLKLATWLGVAGIGVCAVLLVSAVITHLIGVTVPGWSSLIVAMMFLGAVQLFCLGLLGEYVGRIYAAVQARPPYLVLFDSIDRSDRIERTLNRNPVPPSRDGALTR
jgi:polyisoprenyl-phosphate glycosyltransferase